VSALCHSARPALASLLAFAGHQVVREYYVNDAGGQVDVLARSAHLRDREALSTSILQPGDWMFQRSVPAGRLLSWRDVARRALVRKGDVIEVAAVDGSLQVTLKAQALQDGGRGETVRVRNLDSKREFAALVVAPNRAEVRF
jgi:flagella basal body P-ring formation protein FlgA